ncbi:membrane protein [Hyphomicrobium nitrativorans NL23]|uniref:Membrane protein n=1 Tax=Hyphomicrobium nitrativorans NL23 TaxID=1029756 RepID=V5SEJ1_9HYPH|nr:HPP family protein [Hyphomicrobium nitrativorans]AHB48369.1 membrane protein [Hyphomicrobium nitrativorans NL23]
MTSREEAIEIPVDARARQWVAALPWRQAALAGIGGALAIGLLAVMNATETLPLLIPPFGASCVLVFGVSASPFARPRNVIGGHVISAAVGLVAVSAFGGGVLGVAAGVGLAIAAMILSDTVHPPAGANPIVVALSGAGWPFLIAPVLIGAATIVVCGWIYNRMRTGASV